MAGVVCILLSLLSGRGCKDALPGVAFARLQLSYPATAKLREFGREEVTRSAEVVRINTMTAGGGDGCLVSAGRWLASEMLGVGWRAWRSWCLMDLATHDASPQTSINQPKPLSRSSLQPHHSIGMSAGSGGQREEGEPDTTPCHACLRGLSTCSQQYPTLFLYQSHVPTSSGVIVICVQTLKQ
jgi:hypothetical protein